MAVATVCLVQPRLLDFFFFFFFFLSFMLVCALVRRGRLPCSLANRKVVTISFACPFVCLVCNLKLIRGWRWQVVRTCCGVTFGCVTIHQRSLRSLQVCGGAKPCLWRVSILVTPHPSRRRSFFFFFFFFFICRLFTALRRC